MKHDIVALFDIPNPWAFRRKLTQLLGTVPEIPAPPYIAHEWLCKWHGIDIYTDSPTETLIEVIRELSNE